MSSRGLCVMLLVAGSALLNGCASNGGGSVHGSVYYGAGWHDPYYGYTHGWYGGAVVVPNPPDRPDRPDRPDASPPRTTNLPASAPASRPSIPSASRRTGGGGGGGRRR